MYLFWNFIVFTYRTRSSCINWCRCIDGNHDAKCGNNWSFPAIVIKYFVFWLKFQNSLYSRMPRDFLYSELENLSSKMWWLNAYLPRDFFVLRSKQKRSLSVLFSWTVFAFWRCLFFVAKIVNLSFEYLAFNECKRPL